MRLAHLFEETAQQSEVAAQADPHAGWPGNVGCGLFDIATVCVRRKAKQRPTMDQVFTEKNPNQDTIGAEESVVVSEVSSFHAAPRRPGSLATATVFSLPKLTNQRYSSPPCCW